MDLDAIEKRFLLACSSDAVIGIYDAVGPIPDGQGEDAMRLLTHIHKDSPGAHTQFVSSVCWYPIDNGIFVSGSYDSHVKIWDANALEAVLMFEMEGTVLGTSMSKIANSHCLIAVHGSMKDVTLCDLQSGGSSHKLIGHSAAVYSCAWSVSSEWELITGGKDGQLRLWDIRRPGTRHVFNMNNTKYDMHMSLMHAGHGLPSSSQQAAKAHSHWVIGCTASPNGLFWVSTGNDRTIRLWDVETKMSLTRHCEKKCSKSKFPRGISMSEDGRALFHPSDNSIQILSAQDGRKIGSLDGGHFGQVHSCLWNDKREELYSCGADRSLLVWRPKISHFDSHQGIESDTDAWSDDYLD